MRFAENAISGLFELVTLGAAATVILATIFDWFEFTDNVYRNIALSLAGLLLVAILHTRREVRRQRDSSKALSSELSEWRSAFRLVGSEIDASDISRRLDAALESANRWAFSGGTGSWQRASVLPELSKITSTTVTYQMQVVDILDRDLCGAYARYRMASNQNSGTTERSLVLEILSSIVAVCWYGAFTRIEPTVCFTTDYSPLRYDMSGSECFITAANRGDPALVFSSSSWIYRHLEDEFTQDGKTLPHLRLVGSIDFLIARGRHAPLSVDELRTLLDSMSVIKMKSDRKIVDGLALTDEEVQMIWDRSGVSTS